MPYPFKNMLHDSRNSKKLVESLERGFSFMSESAKTSTLWHLEYEYGISLESIPERLDDLREALRKIFGTGSDLVEKKLTEQICTDYNLPIDRVTELSRAVQIVLTLLRASNE